MRSNKVGHTGITWPFTPQGAQQAIADISRLGYAGVELFGFVIDAYPGGVDAVRGDLERAGLRLSAAYCSVSLVDPAFREDDVKRMEAWARDVASLGGDVVVVGPSPRRRPSYGADDYREVCTTLNQIGERCADIGVKACFHPHTGTPVESREEIGRVMDNIDPGKVFMAPDTGQIAKGGGDPAEVVRTYAALVRHIHLKDYVGGESKFDRDGELVDRTGYLDYVPLGSGVVDFPAIIAELESNGYDGWWMAELDGTEQAPHSPGEAARLSKEYLNQVLALSGSPRQAIRITSRNSEQRLSRGLPLATAAR